MTRVDARATACAVVLKPTDFREDEVLFAACSPGGTSLVARRGLHRGAHGGGGGAVRRRGRAQRDRPAEAAGGDVAGVGADIGELHEGLSGRGIAARPGDALPARPPEVHRAAASTAPRSWRTAARPAPRCANRVRQPGERLRGHAARRRSRRTPARDAALTQRDLRPAGHATARFEIYRERFADASDFTFYLVGSFDPETLRPLVAALPRRRSPPWAAQEQGRDLGIRPPARRGQQDGRGRGSSRRR